MIMVKIPLFSRVKNALIKEGGKAFVSIGKRVSSTILNSEIEMDNSERVAKFKQYQRAYERVPLISAIIDVQADQAVQDFHFEGPNSEKLTDFANKVNLMGFFHKVVKGMLTYGNAYVEVVKDGEEISELKVLDPIWFDVYREDNGDIIGYSQIIQDNHLILWGSTGDSRKNEKFKIKLGKEEMKNIAHFRYNVLRSEKYGRSVLAPLMSNLKMKLDMEVDLSKVLFKYVAPLIWAKVGSDQMPAQQSQVTAVSNTLRDLQAESEVTTSHLVDLQVLGFNAKGMDIKTPMDYMEQQIITGGLVPPVLLARTGANTGDAEVQLRSFGRHIKSLQRELKYEFEDNILVMQGLGSPEDQLVWQKAEEREWEVDVDMIRGLVTDGIITPQKGNDLLPPKYKEVLPEIDPMSEDVGADGVKKPRPTQRKANKVTDKPNDPTQTTKNKNTQGRRIKKNDRKVPVK